MENFALEFVDYFVDTLHLRFEKYMSMEKLAIFSDLHLTGFTCELRRLFRIIKVSA